MINPIIDIILGRKSVRHFTDEPLKEGQMEILLRAAMAAPSAKNTRPWRFVVLQEKPLMQALANELPYCKMLGSAAAGIVVCCQKDAAHQAPDPSFWYQDCAAASQNILIAAESLGLGACWTAVHPYPDRIDSVCRHLQLPEGIIPFCVIPLGYSDGRDKVRDKWDASNIHLNRW